MTGYGTAEAVIGGRKVHVEIKSLNSKSLDLQTKVSTLFREKEMEIRDMISVRLIRGKVDFTLWIEQSEQQGEAKVSARAVGDYKAQLESVAGKTGLPLPENIWEIILQLPGVMENSAPEELGEEDWAEVRKLVETALERLVAFRKQEGAALERKFQEKIDNIAALLESIRPYEEGRTEKIRQRLLGRIEELGAAGYDENRLEQEMIYYIEKLDISEEKQRLSNHLRYFAETMSQEPGQGKKLGFIAQEMGREINTTGSKSNQAEMQNIVVKMKDELEQIKEQVLNAL